MSGEGLQRARRRAWVGYATGLEIFNIPVVYAIFVPYFIADAVGDPVRGQEIWGYAAGLGGLIGALIAVPLGFAAERPSLQRRFLTIALALNAIPAFAFWLAAPGVYGDMLFIVLLALGVAMAANDVNYALLSGMLGSVAPSAVMGRTSAAAVTLGWAVGIAVTGVFSVLFVWGDPLGVGLDPARGEAERLIGPVAGTLMLVFCAPLVLLPNLPRAAPPKRTVKKWLADEVGSLLEERTVALAIAARILYWAGLVLVQLFGAGLARSVFEWDTGATTMFGLAVLAFGAIGALIGGLIDDRIGSRNTLLMTIAGLTLVMSAILTLQPDRILLVFEAAPRAADAPMLSSAPEQFAIALGALAGLFIGPMGPVTRTLITRLAPPGRIERYFGIGALAGNTSSAFAPILVALFTAMSGDQRLGLLIAPALLLGGGAFLLLLPAARDARTDGPPGSADGHAHHSGSTEG